MSEGGGPPAEAENSPDIPEAIRRLVSPFFEQNGPVFVTRCCNFLYAGGRPAERCGTCKQPVGCREVKSVEEAVAVLTA